MVVYQMCAYQETSNIIEEYINQYQENLSELQKQFISFFYKHVYHKDVTENYGEYYIRIALGVYDYISSGKHLNSAKIYVPNINENGWISDNYVLEIHHQDVPFLVDSISNFLIREGFNIVQTIHPVIFVLRDENNEMKAISLSEKDKMYPESVMHIQFNNIKQVDVSSILEKINFIIKNIVVAVDDWKLMLSSVDNIRSKEDSIRQEDKDFLIWLQNNNFTFLGYAEVSATGSLQNAMGIAKIDNEELHSELVKYKKRDNSLVLSKVNYISPVHRSINLDSVTIFGKDAVYKIVGLFTSAVYYQSAMSIPIIREKVDYVLKSSGFTRSSYNQKEILAIIETFPRDELLQISKEVLYNTSMDMMKIHERPQVKLFVHYDDLSPFISFIVFIPRNRFSEKTCKQISDLIANNIGGRIDRDYIYVSDSRLARYHVVVNASSGALDRVELSEIEDKISKMTSLWEEDFKQMIHDTYSPEDAMALHKNYANSFPVSYQDRFGLEHICNDIKNIESCIKTGEYIFYVNKTHDEGLYGLIIYTHDKQIPLSVLMPILDNIGFYTIDSSVYEISRPDIGVNPWVHTFRVKIKNIEFHTDFKHLKNNLESILYRIFTGKMKSDKYNAMVLTCGISWRDIMLVKSISKYIKQVGEVYNLDFIASVLNSYPDIVSKIIELFYAKFNISNIKTQAEINSIIHKIYEMIATVSGSSEDKILRAYINVIQSMLRTNFFQKDANGNFKEYVSFKIRSKEINNMPLPHPYAEIFVYSYFMEGVHLRGGEVARGGIRLSDRLDDYRTEVLGLMKAQMAKNVIIVPVGSKGVVVVKNSKIGSSREEKLQESISAYKTLLYGMLDITDNIIDGKIVNPKEVHRYDDNDPYLVVAADKGTATFSDIANGISKNYNFWLGDAFASGGSNGYDHKKMAITSRGTWIAVTRHFSEFGIDPMHDEITTVGIGDMSGDVFGNGMLMSNKIKLVGAFNHMHIFVDPHPDAARSYEERKRLFNTPGTTWADYDKSIMSFGGMIYERKAKSLDLTPQIMDLFGIKSNKISPDDLIKAMLGAEVDLLWNGGIGTYVKAKDEQHEHVKDKTNDTLRVNGEDLRCKVVGEGGNLGFTQLGRIEYALKGGRINTDAIDNSAGVDCSDHEVNIKILFNMILKQGNVTEDERNTILEQMQDNVANLVLADNINQTLALSIEQMSAPDLITEHGMVILAIEKEGLLDRAIEYLPNDHEIEIRAKSKLGMTRPELAVLLAYTKLSFYGKLINTKISDDEDLQDLLVSYFPKIMQDKYIDFIVNHPLKKEIITTVITNDIINKVGISFAHLTIQDTGCSYEEFVFAYYITNKLLDINNLWDQIYNSSNISSLKIYEALTHVQKIVQTSILWVILNIRPNAIRYTADNFKPQIDKFRSYLATLKQGVIYDIYQANDAKMIKLGLLPNIAKEVADIRVISISYDIMKFASSNNISIERASDIYYFINETLQFAWINSCVSNLVSSSYWQRVAKKSIFDEIDSIKINLCKNLLALSSNADTSDSKKLFDHLNSHHSGAISKYNDFISNLNKDNNLELATIIVILKKIKYLFCESLGGK